MSRNYKDDPTYIGDSEGSSDSEGEGDIYANVDDMSIEDTSSFVGAPNGTPKIKLQQQQAPVVTPSSSKEDTTEKSLLFTEKEKMEMRQQQQVPSYTPSSPEYDIPEDALLLTEEEQRELGLVPYIQEPQKTRQEEDKKEKSATTAFDSLIPITEPTSTTEKFTPQDKPKRVSSPKRKKYKVVPQGKEASLLLPKFTVPETVKRDPSWPTTGDSDLDFLLDRRYGRVPVRQLEAFTRWGPSIEYYVTPGPSVISERAAEELSKHPQRGPEWLLYRGMFMTGSRIGNGIGLGYEDMHREYEYDTGRAIREEPKGEKKRRMEWGTENEDWLRDYYRSITGYTVVESGLIVCREPGRGYLAISPDGIVKDDKTTVEGGVLEIKVSEIKKRTNAESYWMTQIQLQMYVTKKPWCDLLMAHIPRYEGNVRKSRDSSTIYVRRIYKSDEYCDLIIKHSDYYCRCVWDYIYNGIDHLSHLKSIDIYSLPEIRYGDVRGPYLPGNPVRVR